MLLPVPTSRATLQHPFAAREGRPDRLFLVVGDPIPGRPIGLPILVPPARALAMPARASLSGYAAVVNRYIYDLPKHNPAGLLNDPGWREHYAIRQERNGDITIEMPGVGRAEWRAAIDAKLISPRYKWK